MRHARVALLACLAAVGCGECACAGEEDGAIAEAVREGDAERLEGALGGDPDARVSFRSDPRELARGEPAEWLASFIKYHQLLWSRLYTSEPTLCPPDDGAQGAAAAERPPAAESLGELGRQLREASANDLERLTNAVRSFDDVTSLHLAAFFCQEALVDRLLALDATVDARDQAQMTPLHWASCGAVVTRLCEAGADASARSETQLTPLHLAVSIDVVRALVACGGDVAARDRCGNTPLHFAGFHGLRFGSGEAPASPTEADLGELPGWARLLLRLVEDAAEIMRLLAERFDVWSALVEAGADAEATNAAGHGPGAVRPSGGGGGDWDD